VGLGLDSVDLEFVPADGADLGAALDELHDTELVEAVATGELPCLKHLLLTDRTLLKFFPLVVSLGVLDAEVHDRVVIVEVEEEAVELLVLVYLLHDAPHILYQRVHDVDLGWDEADGQAGVEDQDDVLEDVHAQPQDRQDQVRLDLLYNLVVTSQLGQSLLKLELEVVGGHEDFNHVSNSGVEEEGDEGEVGVVVGPEEEDQGSDLDDGLDLEVVVDLLDPPQERLILLQSHR